VGGQINRAIQYLNTHDIDALVLHHNRKGDATVSRGDDYEPTVEDVYGSNWITSGAGSVIVLHGAPGAELVKLWHVKQPAEPLGPWMLEHDHNTGHSKIVHGFDILAWLKSRGAKGGTAMEAAKAEHAKEVKSSGKESARAKRRLDGLEKAGWAVRVEGLGRDINGQQAPARWVYSDRDDPFEGRDGAPKSRDAAVTVPPLETSVTAPCQTVTENTKPQVAAVTAPVTHRDEPSAVTNGGGYIYPHHGKGEKLEAEIDDLFTPLPLETT
jgi:hypothetical protein